MLVVVAVVARDRGAGGGPDGPGGPGGPGGPDGGPGAIGEGGIPGLGSDTFLAGGLTRVPVPEGWTLVTRGNRPDNPGGYAESAVIRHAGSGVSLAAYVLADVTDPGQVGATAEERARAWTGAAQQPQVGGAQPFGGAGSFPAAVVGYTYTRGAGFQGEAVAVVRGDGVTLVVFVDAPAGQLDGARGTWEPVRAGIVRGFTGA